MEEISIFGVPPGNARKAGATIEAPPDPPALITPATSPWRRIQASNASAIAATDAPRSRPNTADPPRPWFKATSCAPARSRRSQPSSFASSQLSAPRFQKPAKLLDNGSGPSPPGRRAFGLSEPGADSGGRAPADGLSPSRATFPRVFFSLLRRGRRAADAGLARVEAPSLERDEFQSVHLAGVGEGVGAFLGGVGSEELAGARRKEIVLRIRSLLANRANTSLFSREKPLLAPLLAPCSAK